jgi:glycosyltransferase involved in cell wall biosynthesis
LSTKKVLYFYQAGHYPNPRRSGADRVFFVNVNALTKAGYQVIYVEVGDGSSTKSGKEDEFILLEDAENRQQSSGWKYRYQRWVYPVVHPGNNRYSPFLSKSAGLMIQTLLEKYEPELLFYENIRTYLLSSELKTDRKSIVCIHDLDYILNYGKNLIRVNNSRSKTYIKTLKKIQLKLQYLSEKIWTKHALKTSDALYVVSQNDYKTLSRTRTKLFHADCPVTVFPDISQKEIIESKLASKTLDKIKIIHVGKLSASHNSKGVAWFLTKCWPMLKVLNTSIYYEIHFIGSTEGYDDDLVQYRDEPRLKFHGFVENLEEELLESNFMIVPPGYPTGVRTKIPEAFAWGLPVVTGYHDAFGAGIGKGDPGVLIADSPDDYVDACVQLINDTSKRNAMGKQAFLGWSEKYDQTSITESITMNISEVI